MDLAAIVAELRHSSRTGAPLSAPSAAFVSGVAAYFDPDAPGGGGGRVVTCLRVALDHALAGGDDLRAALAARRAELDDAVAWGLSASASAANLAAERDAALARAGELAADLEAGFAELASARAGLAAAEGQVTLAARLLLSYRRVNLRLRAELTGARLRLPRPAAVPPGPLAGRVRGRGAVR